jgi:hypothetical protein
MFLTFRITAPETRVQGTGRREQGTEQQGNSEKVKK